MWGRAFDLAVIGGGINGCSIARDAAGRGMSVFLCDEGDLAGGSSSASAKLLHGLPRSLTGLGSADDRAEEGERDLLIASAPHVARPLRLVLPQPATRLGRMAQRGRMAGGRLLGQEMTAARAVSLGADRKGATLQAEYLAGYEYPGASVDDSRLVVLTASDARTRGAEIRPRTRCVVAEREGTLWRLAMEGEGGERYAITARVLVNAAGPWVSAVLDHVVHGHARPRLRLVKGVSIVVPRLYAHDRGYVLRNTDGHTIFVSPYQRDFTLIGSSEEAYCGDPGEVAADSADIAYLISAVGRYFRRPLYDDDVVWAWAGVHALPETGERRFFDRRPGHAVEIDGTGREPPLVTIVGGSIGFHRRLAEEVLERLAPAIGFRAPWTAGVPLPGGLFPVDGLAELARGLRSLYPFLGAAHAARLVSLYGTRAHTIVSGARAMADLGMVFGADLTEAEVRYLMAEEWAGTAEDILWRRTKLGLRFGAEEAAGLDAWLAGVPEEAGMRRMGAA